MEMIKIEALREKQLELLKCFVSICERYNLRWFCVCGTALGAVKYNGYIPWDDDIDVALPRPDYEIFLKHAQKLLPEHIFLQNSRTDRNFPHAFSKLRNSNTTQIEAGLWHLRMNHGMYIDIFPLDGYPKGESEQKCFDMKRKVFDWKRFCALKGNQSIKVRVRNTIFRSMGYHKRTAQVIAQLEKLYLRYPVDQSEYWCNYGNWQGKLEYAHRQQYGSGVRAVFEGISVIVPENYEAYLTQKYGDWRSDPPATKRKSHHNVVICDADRSYTEYLN